MSTIKRTRRISWSQKSSGSGIILNDSDVDTLRTENRKLRAAVQHLTDELRDAHERIAHLAQELARVRAMVPSQGPSTS